MAAMATLTFETAIESVMREYDPSLQLKEMQRCALKMIWDGDKFVIVCLPTGYGKSLIYHICGKWPEKRSLRTAILVYFPYNPMGKQSYARRINMDRR